jgi:hypothetical protein
MNDPTFVEAARVLATELLDERGQDRTRLRQLWMIAMSREPSNVETEITLKTLNKLRVYYSAKNAAADELLAVGEYPLVETKSVLVLARSELAAWTCLCSVILQQDEVLTQH